MFNIWVLKISKFGVLKTLDQSIQPYQQKSTIYLGRTLDKTESTWLKKTLKKDNTKIAVELLTRIYPGPCKSPHLDMVTIKATDAFSKADSCHFFTHDHCKPENVRSKHQHPKILFDTIPKHIISGAIVQLGQSFDTVVRLSAVRGDIWQY